MPLVREITDYLENVAPLTLQENYDNSGLILGNKDQKVTGVLIALDCTELVIDEAIEKGINMVISHHPIVFKGLKRLNGSNYVERTIIKAIKHDVAIYAIHTNLDHVNNGVNAKFAEKLRLSNTRILKPLNNLRKLVCFVPQAYTDQVLKELHRAGAGSIGEYSECSFRVTGTGRFTPGASTNPVIGQSNVTEEVAEDRIEVILTESRLDSVLGALKSAHPYEEVAYYLSNLDNLNEENGSGLIGTLDKAMSVDEFLADLKKSMGLNVIKHTAFKGSIKNVAICGGSGSFLLKDAIRQGADAYITGDVKYHDFFDAEEKLLYCDIGHYESEVATKELLHELLSKKFTNFAFYLSEIVTNPIKYYK